MSFLIRVDGQMFTALRDFAFYNMDARNSEGRDFFQIFSRSLVISWHASLWILKNFWVNAC